MHGHLHFLHHHPLQEIENNTSAYLCDGCKCLGVSTRYRCDICDFDLHECCANSTATLASFLHPPHQLSLVVCPTKSTICDLCGDQVEGLFYRCKICDFDIHPLCTQLPEYINDSVHKLHPLRFESGKAGWCRICFEQCTSWRYRCGTCGFNYHLGCILEGKPPQRNPISHENDCSSSRSVASAGSGTSVTGKKVCLFVGKVAFKIISEGLGIPDVSDLFL